MKFNKILVFSFILLSVFLIGQVTAAENITEEIIGNETLPSGEDVLQIDESVEDVPLTSNETEIADEINVTFDEQMWKENLSDIKVDMPQEASGRFCVKINDGVIYNETITEKSIRVPVKLPQSEMVLEIAVWPPVDSRTYKVSAFYNDIELNISNTLKVMKYSPQTDLWWNFPSEILRHDDSYGFMEAIIFPRSACGEAELYVDDRMILKTQPSGGYVFYNKSDVINLDLGNHTFKVIYYGDSYYLPSNKSFNFSIENAVINVPETINIGHDTCISVTVLKNITGKVKVYIDNVCVYSANTENGEFLLSLEDYLKSNSTVVKVVFQSDKFSRTKTVPIDIIYDFDVYWDSYVYGEKNVIEIYLPDNLNNNLLDITVNGKKYGFTRAANIVNNLIEVDISKLDAGNYTMVISYPGDEKFVAKTKIFNFTVNYRVIYPFSCEFKDGSYVYLNLPKDANGTLKLFINGILFKSVKVSNGKATIKVDGLKPGRYSLNAEYTGNDYDVDSGSNIMIISPKITTDYYFTVGEDKYITVQVPSSAKGYVLFKMDDKSYKINIKNGLAKFSLKNLKAGEHEIEIEYYGEDGFKDIYNWRVVTVYKPKITSKSVKLYTTGLEAKFKVTNNNGKAMAGVKVTLKINGRTVVGKSNKKGIVTFKLSKSFKTKKYKLTVTARGAKVTKTVKARHSLSLKSVKVKKSLKKLTLKASLKQGKTPVKSKTVTFKFNGKTYKAKTNSKGIAKVIIKNSVLKKLKVGKKVTYRATYLKDSVKKSVKIQK